MNILIADDHELVSEMLKMTLEREPDTRVHTVRNFDDAVRAAGTKRVGAAQPFNLVLLDMRMPGMNGLSGLRRMRDLLGQVPVAIISGMLTPAEARQVMQEGAAGFVPKTLPLEELVAAIHKMVGGERFVPSFLMVSGNDSAVVARKEAPRGLAGLTPRETEVLQELVQGWTNKQIAHNLGVTEVTVKTHLIGLFRKLGAKNRADAVRIALAKMHTVAEA
ncbi:MAG: response regulator transcription factor [Proteobacteria bacterium]|nr:response regulator transcription factor [Pseudomonadota bacterium]MBI3496355.1 response regulator transcription factor [Pseudomonadota bacterium]